MKHRKAPEQVEFLFFAPLSISLSVDKSAYEEQEFFEGFRLNSKIDHTMHAI